MRVSNFSSSITHDDLRELFSKHGKLTECRIFTDKLGVSQGEARIEYEKPEAAEKAIQEYNGATLDEKTLSVEYDQRRRPHNVQKRFIRKPNFDRRDDRGGDRRNRGGRRN